MTADRPGVVFDCNVLLQAALNENGPAGACLRALDQNRITVFASRATLSELRDILLAKKLADFRVARHQRQEILISTDQVICFRSCRKIDVRFVLHCARVVEHVSDPTNQRRLVHQALHESCRILVRQVRITTANSRIGNC